MKNKFLIFLARLNFIFPHYLGIKFINYGKFLKENYNNYNNTVDVLKMVNHSISNIPFYKNLKINSLNNIEDLHNNFPFIDKDLVMEQWDKFILPNYDASKVTKGTTGGTSGKPLKLILPKNRYIFELATMYSMWNKVGWSGQMRGVIRNQKLRNNEIFKVNPIKKEVIFDGFRASYEYYEHIYNTLRKFNITFLHAYPSSAYQFAQFLFDTKKDVTFIKAIFCGSEGLLPEQEHLIRKVLGITIYHWYGHSEKLVLGGYCKGSNFIHVEPTYGYFELIDDNANPITKVGDIGEIVGTTLHNPYMPLIRYKTGDYAEYAGNYCKYCKRHLPLLKKIYGRWDKNKIYKQDGSYITTTALNLHSNLYEKIVGLQYVQKKKGKLEVRIIKGFEFSEVDYNELINHYNTSFDEENEVKIKFVESLEKLPNGKFLNLISDLN